MCGTGQRRLKRTAKGLEKAIRNTAQDKCNIRKKTECLKMVNGTLSSLEDSKVLYRKI